MEGNEHHSNGGFLGNGCPQHHRPAAGRHQCLFEEWPQQLGQGIDNENTYIPNDITYQLRNGVPQTGGLNAASPDTIKAMPPEMTFDYWRIDPKGPSVSDRRGKL